MTVNSQQSTVNSTQLVTDNCSLVTLKLQQLESQLSSLLKLKPKSPKERKKLERETERITRSVASLKAYLALEVGERVTDGQKLGVIADKTLSPGGMPQAWVSWFGAVEVPEQPERLTVIKPPPYATASKPQLNQDAPTIASLFTGGGLLEAGALAAGFRPLWGIEFDPEHPDFSRQIADAYEQNFGAHIIRQTVQEVAKGGFQHLERPTALHVSQPCKSFSAANANSETEQDLSAARATQQAIRELQPEIVTIENVVSYRDSQSWRLIRETLNELGYGIKEAVVNAADYGVPQTRKRFLVWAVRVRTPPELPPKVDKWMGWKEGIADLIPTLPESQLADWQLERIQNPAAPRFRGGSATALTQSKSFIQNGKAYLIERSGARKDRDLLIRQGAEPSWTIRASIATDQKGANRHDPLNALLPEGKVVSLTQRAIARLQSVPDWYQLPDQIGVAVTLLGNGVPCLLAFTLMKTLHPVISQDEIQIDSEFKALIPPLSNNERTQLLANLLASGCRDPLVIWKGHNILLDGHNRYEICTSHGIEFKTVEIDLPDRDAAHDWLINNQLGRRNLTPEAVSYLRGKRYNREKRQGKRTDLTSGHFGTKLTADQLAHEYKVGTRTIKRDAQFAGAVDTLADVVGEDVRPSILSRDAKLTKKQTLQLAKLASENPDAVIEKFKPGAVITTERTQPTIKPFPIKVGEVCRVIPKDSSQLRGRGGCWAIVTKVHEFCCDIQLWNGTAELIKPEHLVSLEYTPDQCSQREKLCERIARLREYNLEPDAQSILSNIGRQKQPELTPFQENLLAFLEQQYGLRDTSNDENVTLKVEANTNEILMAFARQLGCLSNEQVKFVGKAISRQSPELVEKLVSAIGIYSKEQAVEIVKSIVLVYPEAIRQLLDD